MASKWHEYFAKANTNNIPVVCMFLPSVTQILGVSPYQKKGIILS